MEYLNSIKKSKKQILAFVGLALLAGVISFSLAKNQTTKNTQNSVATGANNVVQVSLLNDHADPDSLSIKVGQTVQFNSKDKHSHFLTSGEGGSDHQHDKGGFESGEFGADQAWKATFNKKGTYTVHDHNYPSINVLVVVY